MHNDFRTKEERDECVTTIYDALRNKGWAATRTVGIISRAAQITIPTVYNIIKRANNENTEQHT